MNKRDKIFVAGHRGMVGSAIVRKLKAGNYNNLVLRTRSELDLCNQSAVELFFAEAKPDYVFLSAAKVGGILANNTYRAEFLYDNLMIEANVIHSAHRHGVKKLVFLASSCIYPKLAPQPIKEEYLLTGILEPTNEPYAIAKIAGVKLCDAYRDQYGSHFISAMPTNLYGPNDNYDLQNSHVLPALLRKIHEAKINRSPSITIWGTGKPRREFMYVDDLADACLFLMQEYDKPGIINVGVGYDVTILELAQLIKSIVAYDGAIEHDLTEPDGTPRKLMDNSKLTALGWTANTNLEDGIRITYEHYLKSTAKNK